jgi:translation initiation factor 3 subunit F
MLDRVLSYVQSVLSGEVKGDPAVGRYLMDTLGASTDDLEKGGFSASLQVRRLHLGSAVIGLFSSAGHTNGVISREPCAITSGNIFSVGPHNIVIVNSDRKGDLTTG